MANRFLNRIAGLSLSAFLAASAHGQPTDRILIDGSTGVLPLAVSLARAFQEQNPAVAVEAGKGLGTKARIQALADGRIDVALASHGLNTDEISRLGMAAHEIARIGVVFGVNGSVAVANVTAQQVCDVYAGKITNWRALGGADLEIAARTRPDTEVDAEVVRANVRCLADLRMHENVKVMPTSGDMARELASATGAIGMTTTTVVEQSQGRIRALSLDGAAATAVNVERRAYPLVRQSFFVTKATPTPTVARFLEFARSPAGEQVIRANGAIPVK
jgi:phosphate transport system substrate-binding protein